MARRRRLHSPWIPGFWPLVAFLVLLSSVGGYFYFISRATKFERRTEKVER